MGSNNDLNEVYSSFQEPQRKLKSDGPILVDYDRKISPVKI